MSFTRKLVGFFRFFGVLCVILLSGFAVLQATDTPGAAEPKQDNLPAAEVVGDWPEAFFPQTQFEFDTVMEGVEIKHDFIIENHGKAPLVIKSVRPD